MSLTLQGPCHSTSLCMFVGADIQSRKKRGGKKNTGPYVYSRRFTQNTCSVIKSSTWYNLGPGNYTLIASGIFLAQIRCDQNKHSTSGTCQLKQINFSVIAIKGTTFTAQSHLVILSELPSDMRNCETNV